MRPRNKPKVKTSITISKEVKDAGQIAAEKERRSFSGFVEYLIRRYVTDNNLDDLAPTPKDRNNH